MKITQALILGGIFVCILELLGHHQVATPVPFWLLLPGIMAGTLAPDSGFSPEGDVHPWGLFSTFIVYVINVGLYSGLAYLALVHVPSRRKLPQ
jgi:hypothetical protein